MSPQFGFSGFPYYNSHTEVDDAIAAAGFSVVLHATNHAADQGVDGLKNCVSFWEEQHPDILMTGIFGDEPAEEMADAGADLIIGTHPMCPAGRVDHIGE